MKGRRNHRGLSEGPGAQMDKGRITGWRKGHTTEMGMNGTKGERRNKPTRTCVWRVPASNQKWMNENWRGERASGRAANAWAQSWRKHVPGGTKPQRPRAASSPRHEAKALVDQQQKSLRCPHFRFNKNIIEQTSAEVAKHTARQD